MAALRSAHPEVSGGVRGWVLVFSCLEDHSPKATRFSAPEIVVSCVLSSSLVVYDGKLRLVLVPPS